MAQNEYQVKEASLDAQDILVVKAAMRGDRKVGRLMRLVILGIFGLYAIFIAVTHMTDWTFYVIPFVILVIYIGLEVYLYNSKGDLRLDLQKGVKIVLEGHITKKLLTRVTDHQFNSISTHHRYSFWVGGRDFEVDAATFHRLREGQPVRVVYLKYSKLVLHMEFPQSLGQD